MGISELPKMALKCGLISRRVISAVAISSSSFGTAQKNKRNPVSIDLFYFALDFNVLGIIIPVQHKLTVKG